MNIRKDIPLEEFELIISPPTNRLATMCVNIYSDGRFNLNGKLIEKIGCSKVSIRFTRDGKYLCLAENGDISFPKSGSRNLSRDRVQIDGFRNFSGVAYTKQKGVSY